MIEHLYYYVSENTNPYHNQAVQAYIFEHIPDNSMVFMMWQDNETISIGKNQSVYNQMNFPLMQQQRCHLIRRESVGPLLFHDLGTIKYAFFSYLNNFDIIKQTNVIYRALRKLNLPVFMNDRNEILLEGKRIVDDTVFSLKEHCWHEGALHWDTDQSKPVQYLKEINCRNLPVSISASYPCVNILEVKRKILQSLANSYGKAQLFSLSDDLQPYVTYYQNCQYVYETEKPYTLVFNETLEDNIGEFYVDMLKNRISHMDVYLSKEDEDFSQAVKTVFESGFLDDASLIASINDQPEEYHKDLYRIMQRIKKEGYPI